MAKRAYNSECDALWAETKRLGDEEFSLGNYVRPKPWLLKAGRKRTTASASARASFPWKSADEYRDEKAAKWSEDHPGLAKNECPCLVEHPETGALVHCKTKFYLLHYHEYKNQEIGRFPGIIFKVESEQQLAKLEKAMIKDHHSKRFYAEAG